MAVNLQTRIQEELWESIRSTYTNGNYSAAILDAIHYLSNLIRERSGEDGDGAKLIGNALGGANPKLRITQLRTETDRNIQQGVEQLLRGLYQAIRNPRSHGKTEDSEPDAETIILFVSYLCRLIGEARAPFSRSRFIDSILDEHFVTTFEYADLLLMELPQRYRVEVFFDLWNRRESIGDHRQVFMRKLLKSLSESEADMIAEAVADDLRVAGDIDIRHGFRLLPSDIWPKIGQAAKLRVENRVIHSVKEGRVSQQRNRLTGGALATWATGFLEHFSESMKFRLQMALMNKLDSADTSEQEYVLQYFFGYMDLLSDKPPQRLQGIVLKKLRDGDRRFQRAMEHDCGWTKADWSEEVGQALEAFSNYDDFEANLPEDDDLPF